MAKILSIIAPQDYQDKEYEDSKSALEKKGHTVITASSTKEAHGKFGGIVQADILIKDANPDDYDAIALIGGPGCYQFFQSPILHTLAKSFFEAGKPTGAICAAPMILAHAGLLRDKKATCWEGEGTNLQNLGAIYTGKSVQIDENLITAAGPASAKKFGKLISKALK